VIGLLLAVVGAVRLWTISRPWATLVLLAYAINTLFAFTYNVGDTHVFYLPGHLFTAFLAGAALSHLAVRKDPPTGTKRSCKVLTGWSFSTRAGARGTRGPQLIGTTTGARNCW
jgi:peptidoglycan/LPS O-acetylase OafA/YrhL